jgi:hypothetical protein
MEEAQIEQQMTRRDKAGIADPFSTKISYFPPKSNKFLPFSGVSRIRLFDSLSYSRSRLSPPSFSPVHFPPP